jgi:hypothetical protein
MASNGANSASDAPTSSEQVKTDIITLTRFLTEEQAKHKEATGDFTSVVTLSYAIHHFLSGLMLIHSNPSNLAFSFMPYNSPSNPSPTGFDVQAWQTSPAWPAPPTPPVTIRRSLT